MSLSPRVHRPRVRCHSSSAAEVLEQRQLLSAGTLDPSFGTGGMVVSNPTPNNDSVGDLIVQEDGKFIALGTAGGGGVVYRYSADGSLDSTFGAGGLALTDPRGQGYRFTSIALQSDGKIVLAGRRPIDRPFVFESDVVLARFNANGTIDTSFGSKGFVVSNLGNREAITDIVLQNDKIVVVGMMTTSAGGDDVLVVRYNANGTLDRSFGKSGVTTTHFRGVDNAAAVALDEEGRVVVTGFTRVSAAGEFSEVVLARYMANGVLDATFGVGGKLVTDAGPRSSYGRDVVVQPDGQILVSGHYEYSVPGSPDPSHTTAGLLSLRYSASGGLDGTFGSGGVLLPGLSGAAFEGAAIALQADGKIVLGGRHGIDYPGGELAVVRLNTDGSLDGSFGSGGWAFADFYGPIYNENFGGMALTADGAILVVGYMDDWHEQPIDGRILIARFLGDPAAPSVETAETSPEPAGARIAVDVEEELLLVALQDAEEELLV